MNYLEWGKVFSAVVTSAWLLGSPASATSIPVLDSSFESIAPGAYSIGLQPPWRFACGAASVCGESGILSLSGAPDGSQVAYTTNDGVTGGFGSIGQDVTTIIPGATYTFSIMVGQSEASALNSYRLFLGYNTTPKDPITNKQFANVLFNTAPYIPGPGEWLLASITAMAPLDAIGNLTIGFGSGSYAMWDQASLSVSEVPLPAALPLFASGLSAMCLLAWRRKRKAKASVAA